MKRFVAVFLVIGVILALLPQPGYSRTDEEKDKEKPRVGEVLPKFQLKTLDGKEFKVEKILGKKPIILNFWATW